MNRRFVVSAVARDELIELVAYIAQDSPRAAENVRKAIQGAFKTLGDRPGIGHLRDDLTDKTVRFWNVMGRYTIIYRGEQPPIEIARVFGPGRDIASLLR